MFRNIKISIKLAALIIALSLIAVAAISVFTYQLNVQSAQEKISATVTTVADQRAALLNEYFNNLKAQLEFLQESKTFINAAAIAAPIITDSSDQIKPDADAEENPDSFEMDNEPSSETPLEPTLLNNIKKSFKYDQVYLLKSDGTIIYSTTSHNGVLKEPDGTFFDRASSGISFSRVTQDTLFAGAPFENNILVIRINLKPLFKQLIDSRFGKTGETIIAHPEPESKRVVLVSPLLFQSKTLLEPSSTGTKEVYQAVDGKEGNGIITDYRGETVMASWRNISAPGWALISKIDEAEYLNQSSTLKTTYYAAGITIILMAIAISMLFSRTLVKPLHEMRNTLELVSKGVLPEQNEKLTKDEFGEMGSKVESLVGMLKSNASFAQKVGEGKFDTEFKPASENDALGLALINMRNNLVENARQNDERNWIVRGVAEASEILRQHDSLEGLGEEIIQFIIKKINAVHAP